MDGLLSPWAAFVAAWSATIGACWPWSWRAPAAPARHPPPPLARGSEDDCHCSCDAELRRAIDRQAEVIGLQLGVWALRCLLVAVLCGGLLLLSGAGWSRGPTDHGGILRWFIDVIADTFDLDTSDPQILARHENDPAGLFWHHRVLLFRADGGTWIALTPDHDLVRVMLLDVRHEALEWRAPPPGHVANQVYARDPASGAALAVFRSRAKMMGQLLGVGQVDAVERMFGEIVEAGIVEDGAWGTSFDNKGATALDCEEFFARKTAVSAMPDVKTTMKTDMGDARTLGERLVEAGQWGPRLSEAVALMCDAEQANFPLSGVRSVAEFLGSAASGPGNMVSSQAELERLAESARLIVRWAMQTEIAVERNPRHLDYSGLDIVISTLVNAVGRASTFKFNS
ncbi:unnamed protein product [Prorocentrum cordatum]|uniref:Uncharacterized protein n=1 Tax=Prorocentrum cordatum TaxID=2364126 RepID=A0ABN9TB44_9DINO|nr:unnamed protein product [Polarella glacialis]